MPQVVHVDSLDDPQVEAFRDVRDKDLRGRDKLFMAESEMVLTRLLRTPERLHSLLLSPNKYERLAESLAVLPSHLPVYVADIDLMTEIAGFHIHRGVLAAGFRPRKEELAFDVALAQLRKLDAFTLLLAEGLTNVDNMGGMFRNAAAFGVDGIVLDPSCCDPLYRKAIRVSMGHALSIPYAVCDNWVDDLRKLKQQWGITLAAAEVTDDAIPLWDIPRVDRLGILFGSEGHGLSAEALAECDIVCQIPMADAVPSLNVATASAVFLYELARCGLEHHSGE